VDPDLSEGLRAAFESRRHVLRPQRVREGSRGVSDCDFALAPDEPLPYGNLAGIYRTLNKPEDARHLLEEAIARGVDSAAFRAELYSLAFMRNDDAEMSRQVEAARRFPDGSVRMLSTQISLALYEGRLARARELATQYATDVGSTLGLKGSAASVWGNVAQSAAVFGDTSTARAAIRSALDLERNIGSVLNGAIASVVFGDAQDSEETAGRSRQDAGIGERRCPAGHQVCRRVDPMASGRQERRRRAAGTDRCERHRRHLHARDRPAR
jgi:Flp pilus assembly protein TadD